MQSAFDVLELHHVLDTLASFCRTEQGKARVLSLRPLDEAKRESELGLLAQAFELIDASGPLPISESIDLSGRVDVAKKGGTLQEGDFSRVLSDLETMRELRKHLGHMSASNDLSARVLALPELEPLRQGIIRVIAPDLSIRDGASVELKRIRGTLERKKKELTSRLGAILEENRNYLSGNSWTMRNGHYVLPVANSYKHQVRGLVQDVSSSGGTTFIEPEYLVRIQNEIALLQAEEREEIRRILAALSRVLGNNAADFTAINQTLGLLDFVQAKALYGASIHGHLPALSEDGSLFLAKARHPLLDPATVVPNDFSLSSSRRILVLSGPNAGGKTVALKTLGILSMMFQMALPLPCASGAELPHIGEIYLDIGDSQSIFDNLSTFSGHIKNITEILQKVRKNDLVLLDEVGTGTSPKEGEALALAILDELRNKGCYALLSSHFEGLKAVALSSTDVENASLLFDEQTLSPTYVLRVGLPGESYGFEVARRLGLPESTLEKARQYLREESDFSVSASLRHLGELTRKAEEKDAEIAALQASLKEKEAAVSRLQKDLERKQRLFEEDMAKQKEALMDEAEAKIDAIIQTLSSPDVKLHEAIAAKKKLDELGDSVQSKATFDGPLELQDYVEIPEFGIEGRIVRIQGNRIEVVDRDGFTFKANKASARRIEAPKQEKKIAVSNVDALPSASLPLEVNLIGMRVAEAMAELDHYLDRCRLKGFKRVRVIHGLGSGALRRATHEYLKAHASFVERFELGGEFEGGGGATVVYLK